MTTTLNDTQANDVNVSQNLRSQISQGVNNRVADLIGSGLRFEEHFVNLGQMKCLPTDRFKLDRGGGSRANLNALSIEFNGQAFAPSERFWQSFCSKVGVAPSVFNLFGHHEVFNRVVEQGKMGITGNIRIVEDVKNKTLLAMTEPTKSIADFKTIMKLIDDKNGYNLSYSNGVITSHHGLVNDTPIKIGSEEHRPRIAVQTSIDGYGLPNVYLALLRQVCSNGAVAMSSAFKTQVKVGKKQDDNDTVEFALERMFDSFSNDEGFDALIQRFDSARTAPLSVREFYQVSQILTKLGYRIRENKDDNMQIAQELRTWHSLSGDLHTKYGLAHLKEMTEKQMSLLETDLTVYEAINYVTEVATHRLNHLHTKDVGVSNALQGWVGTVISKPYDLEGTISRGDAKSEFKDFYFSYN